MHFPLQESGGAHMYTPMNKANNIYIVLTYVQGSFMDAKFNNLHVTL